MQIETLKVFCDLVESRSFSRAAMRNAITQSAVSQQVKNLESRFETQLLRRDGKSVSPTPVGRLFYERSRVILDSFDQMQFEIKSIGQDMVGSVRVETIYSVGLYEISMVVKNFLRQYPKVNLHVEYSKGARVYEDCLRGVIDLGIVTYPEPRKGLRIIPLPADRLILICAPDHPLAKRRHIDIQKLNGENYIAFEKGLASQRALDGIFREHDIEVRTVMEFDNIETIKRSVEIGAGVSIVPLLSVQKEVQNGLLAQVGFTDKNFYRPLGIIVRTRHPISPAARKFIELMQTPQKGA
ncbi:MAG: LysR family transcriptional regulator [Acidobacteriota bacterium]|jgi:DNA-binding transcriptional LysR family regulator|nr:LysR family transcriptional regulator [Acidobacteriota bacterium]